MSMLSEFKAFALRGNVVDMAVGVIIGAAFGAIVASLVSDVMMPVIGLATGGINFSDQAYELKEAVKDAAGVESAPAVLLQYGKLLDAFVRFVVVAFCLFLVIQAMNAAKGEVERLEGKAAAAPAAPPPPPREVQLLEEIRDLLRKR